MTTKTIAGACAAVAALTLSGAAHAVEPDTTPPELVSFAVNPTVVDARQGGAVTATMRITDETCLDDSSPELELDNASGVQYGAAQRAARVSGDCRDGIYETSFPISGADMGRQPFGSWSLTLRPMSDTLGNAAEPGRSDYFEQRYVTYAASPAAAADLVVTGAGTTAVSASWSAPAANGSSILEYVVRIRAADSTTVLTTSVDGTSVDGLAVPLEAGQQYSFEVTAHNMLGGTETAATSFTTRSGEYIPPAQSPFVDITPQTTFYKEMAWMAENKISGGWSTAAGKEYRPSTAVDRDVMAAFLYRLAGSPDYTAPAQSPFVDITPQTTFYKEMAWMAENKISGGWSTAAGKEYRPSTAVDRDVMAAFLYRLSGVL